MPLKRFATVILALLITSGCARASSKDFILPRTDVGAPAGDTVKKVIGPEGGSLTSADGKFTVTVPQNAVSSSTTFSIQPITNLIGFGNAYRLEPKGQAFSSTVQLSFRYDENDTEGTVPEVLALAYQQEDGTWRAPQPEKIDPANRTVVVSTRHFSDWSLVMTRYVMVPRRATVYVRDSLNVNVLVCEQSAVESFLGRQGSCNYVDTEVSLWQVEEYRGGNNEVGTVAHSGKGATYTAPARKPTRNPVKVSVSFTTVLNGKMVTLRPIAYVKVLDRAYEATGEDGPTKYSGFICDLAKPFTVKVTHPLFALDVHFTPDGSSGQADSTKGKAEYKYSGQIMGQAFTTDGAGPYTVQGIDTLTPMILLELASTATIPVASSAGGGTAHIKLVTPMSTPKQCEQ